MSSASFWISSPQFLLLLLFPAHPPLSVPRATGPVPGSPRCPTVFLERRTRKGHPPGHHAGHDREHHRDSHVAGKTAWVGPAASTSATPPGALAVLSPRKQPGHRLTWGFFAECHQQAANPKGRDPSQATRSVRGRRLRSDFHQLMASKHGRTQATQDQQPTDRGTVTATQRTRPDLTGHQQLAGQDQGPDCQQVKPPASWRPGAGIRRSEPDGPGGQSTGQTGSSRYSTSPKSRSHKSGVKKGRAEPGTQIKTIRLRCPFFQVFTPPRTGFFPATHRQPPQTSRLKNPISSANSAPSSRITPWLPPKPPGPAPVDRPLPRVGAETDDRPGIQSQQRLSWRPDP
ncbi:MAG: hypothetical protein CM1200mP2_50920 [Planctomycetaceae bacterium]|nr:MAG: hypothetical protein CM1200mP2_50920 [Planctomycetaceae bacterium]